MAAENVLDATRQCLANTPRSGGGGYVEGHVIQITLKPLDEHSCLFDSRIIIIIISVLILILILQEDSDSVRHCAAMCAYFITFTTYISIQFCMCDILGMINSYSVQKII